MTPHLRVLGVVCSSFISLFSACTTNRTLDASDSHDGSRGESSSPIHTSLEVVPSIFANGCVYLRARLPLGSEGVFLVDTGATTSAIDKNLALAIHAQGIGDAEVLGTLGVERVPTAMLEKIEVGSLAAGPMRVTVSDLSGLLSPPTTPVVGILGADFLHDLTIRFDFDLRSVAIGRGRFDPNLDRERSYDPIPFELDSGIPRLSATVDAIEIALRIDTGASLFPSQDIYINVPERVERTLQNRSPNLAPEFHLQGAGIGGSTDLPVLRAGALCLGNTTIERPYLIVQPPRGYFADPSAAGFFGTNLLEKHHVAVIDYPGTMLYLASVEEKRVR